MVYIHRYQPIGRAASSLTSPDDPHVLTRITDGLRSETWIVRGPTGTTGTVSYTIANNGHFDLTVLGPGPDSDLAYHWAKPWLSDPENGNRPSMIAEAHRLPMTLHAHESIELFVTVTKEHCPPGGAKIVETLPLAWTAFGVHHKTDLILDPQDSTFAPIAVCYPKSALQNAEF